MWAESTLTIAFRGLLVFHRMEQKGESWFEIGFLFGEDIPHHHPRINIYRNSVLDRIFYLEEHIDPDYPLWRLVVDNPIGGGVSTYTPGPFNRKMYPDEKDFRWIMDIESEEFYNEDLTRKLNTRRLLPILRVPHGVFYTRLKSVDLKRFKDGSEEKAFGCAAAVIGCDIPLLGGGARLMEEDRHNPTPIFRFRPEPNVVYEFANTPPDGVPPDRMLPHDVGHEQTTHGGAQHDKTPDSAAAGQATRSEEGRVAHAPSSDAAGQTEGEHPGDKGREDVKAAHEDHFKFYYQMFLDPDFKPKYSFRVPSLGPAPYPALCGLIELGRRREPLK